MPDAVTALIVAAKLSLYAGALSATGAVLFELTLGRGADSLRSRLAASVLLGATVALLAGLAHFGLQAAVLAGGGLSGFADQEMIELLWETQAGDALLLLASGLALLALSRAARRAPRILFAALGVVATLGSFTLVGHANDGPPGLTHVLIAAHLLGVAFWLGALWPLKAAAEGAAPLGDAAVLAERFGNIAALVAPGLIAAGAATAWLLLGSIEAALGSSYGQLLIGKFAIVALLLGLAALNKLRLTPAMQRGDPSAAAALGRSIAIEMLAVLAILAITGVLTTSTTLPG